MTILPTISYEEDNRQAAFYKSGGTLAPDEPSYVRRAADNELLEGLLEGQFCYVLTSRQMGKSSLMNQTATRLRKEGVVVAELDLTGIGQNLTLEQWYDGLVYEIGRRINLKSELKRCWSENAHLGPLHRFLAVLREGVLTECPEQVVIFVDEIEVVRSLPFSTDEFFAAIRECYNRRATDPAMRRLTFCLLGMATPHDLIQDTRITPFNIGRRIELTDFTAHEAKPLAHGLRTGGRDGEKLLERVLYWTNGHPYLTQRICQAVAENLSVTAEKGVDRICNDLFLAAHSRETDANLVPVREYLLRSAGDIAAILEFYRKVHSGRRIPDDTGNPLVSLLQLSGITRAVHGRLFVRNRIYRHVFDKSWILASIPLAEQQRQRAAYRRGLLRSAAIFSAIAIVMLGLMTDAVHQKHLANDRERDTRELLYLADINLASQALNDHNIARVLQILDVHRNDGPHGFEYGYLWRMCHQDYLTCHHQQFVVSANFSADGEQIVTADAADTIKVWDRASKRLTHTLPCPGLTSTALSPDSKWLAASTDSHFIFIWNAKTWERKSILEEHSNFITAITFSPDGKFLAAGNLNGSTTIWNISTWTIEHTFQDHKLLICSLCYSPDNKLLATASVDKTINIWNAASGALIHTLTGHTKAVYCLAFNKDGTWLASGGEDKTAIIWDTNTWKKLHTIYNENQSINTIAFSPATGELVTAGDDNVIKFWNVPGETATLTLDGHTGPIHSIAFSGDGRWLASASWDYTAKVWDTWARLSDYVNIKSAGSSLDHSQLSPDGTLLAANNGSGDVKVWNANNGRKIIDLPHIKQVIQAIAFSGDNVEVAIASGKNHVDIYNTSTAEKIWQADIYLGVIKSLALSRTGSDLAAGTTNGAVQVWNKESAAILRHLPPGTGFKSMIDALAFSPNSTQIAIGTQDHATLIWNWNQSGPPLPLSGHRGAVSGAGFSPDSKILVTGSIDGTLKIWNLARRREILTLMGSSGNIVSADFSKDGHTLKVATGEGTIRQWRAAYPEEMIADAHLQQQ